MSLEKYADVVYEIGSGILRWPPQVTLHEDMDLIMRAYDGHMKHMRRIHGGGEAAPVEAPAAEATPAPSVSNKLRAAFSTMLEKP